MGFDDLQILKHGRRVVCVLARVPLASYIR